MHSNYQTLLRHNISDLEWLTKNDGQAGVYKTASRSLTLTLKNPAGDPVLFEKNQRKSSLGILKNILVKAEENSKNVFDSDNKS